MAVNLSWPWEPVNHIAVWAEVVHSGPAGTIVEVPETGLKVMVPPDAGPPGFGEPGRAGVVVLEVDKRTGRLAAVDMAAWWTTVLEEIEDTGL